MTNKYLITWYSGRPVRGAKLTKLFSAVMEYDYDYGWLGLKKVDGSGLPLWVRKGYHQVARKIT